MGWPSPNYGYKIVCSTPPPSFYHTSFYSFHVLLFSFYFLSCSLHFPITVISFVSFHFLSCSYNFAVISFIFPLLYNSFIFFHLTIIFLSYSSFHFLSFDYHIFFMFLLSFPFMLLPCSFHVPFICPSLSHHFPFVSISLLLYFLSFPFFGKFSKILQLEYSVDSKLFPNSFNKVSCDSLWESNVAVGNDQQNNSTLMPRFTSWNILSACRYSNCTVCANFHPAR